GAGTTPLITLQRMTPAQGDFSTVNGLTVNAPNSTIKDLIIQNFHVRNGSFAFGSGIVVKADNVTISGNQLLNGDAGIAFSGGTLPASDNLIQGNSEGVSCSFAVAGSLTLTGNQILNNQSGGIDAFNLSAAAVSVSGNTITGNGNIAISLSLPGSSANVSI